MKTYLVTYVLKRGGRWEDHEITITAENAKEARAKAEEMWYEHSKMHMFGIKTRLLKDTEEFLYNYFVEVRA